MWNDGVSHLHLGVEAAIRPLAVAAHDHALATVGVVLIFALVIAMLAAEVADDRADSERVDKASPDRPKR